MFENGWTEKIEQLQEETYQINKEISCIQQDIFDLYKAYAVLKNACDAFENILVRREN